MLITRTPGVLMSGFLTTPQLDDLSQMLFETGKRLWKLSDRVGQCS